ncbi:MAG TPA: organomercurial lyase [Candidatus Saccharimonadales bacterium]|nr:organomercurial lyase [Candidatus Saccharimonadales bacterium]
MSTDAVTTAPFDQEVRMVIARRIREQGVIPSIGEVATLLQVEPASAEAAFVRMAEAHVFIPRRGSPEIYAYDPFCSEPTDFAVRAAGRDWSAICGWDALGIPAALRTTGTVRTRCGDGCGEPITIEIGADGTATGNAVFHSGVPARHSWDDIYFT